MNGTVTDPTDRKYKTNKLKNRYVAPASPATVQAADLLKAKTASTAFDETKGGTVEGWIGKVIQERGESCNDFTQTSDDDSAGDKYVDEHIYLFATKADYQRFTTGVHKSEKDRVIDIEATPRVKELARQAGFSWTKKSLSSLVGRHVRITGWLLNDWEHANRSKVDGATTIQRGTCWEIHPITVIEVLP